MIAENTQTFLDDIIKKTPGGDTLRTCLQCGTCSGSCPNGSDMDYSPRILFALIFAGLEEEVLKSNTMWYCLSCYYCTERCPKDIPITDLMYTLKSMAMKKKQTGGTDASALAKTFTDYVYKYGRSFELGLASRFYLTNKPASLLKLGPLGFSMLRHGRMTFKPNKIKQIDQLRSIINKAQSMGGIS